MNIIKKEKLRIFSLILVESCILFSVSIGIACLLFYSLGNLFKTYHVLMTLLCALPIGALIILREKKSWLKKTSEVAFSVILAGLIGIQVYTFMAMVGVDKFWLFVKFAFAAFILTAGLGYSFFRYVRNWKKELYAFGVLGLTIGFELIVIFFNAKLNGIIIAGGMSVAMAIFNMVDFAKMSENLDDILHKKQHRRTHLVIATQLYLNFIGLIYLQDATRLLFRFFYDLTTEKMLKK